MVTSVLLATGCSRQPFPSYPEGHREFAYVANAGGNSVTVLDLVHVRPDRTLAVGVDPVALAVNSRLNEVYVLNAQPEQAAGSLSVIDTNKNVVVATIPLHRDPASLSIDSTGQRAFVVNRGSNTVSAIDLESRRVLASVSTGEKPETAIIAPDGRTLVVTNRTSGSISLYKVNIPPLSNKTTVITPGGFGPPLALRATFGGCPGASAAVILPDSSKAFVACSTAHQVLAVSLAAAPGSWAARQDSSLTSDHVLALLDVGRNPTNLTLKPDGGEVFVSNRDSDSVSEISTLTDEVGSTYAIGQPAHGLVSRDNGSLWISNMGAQAVSLYSIDDGKFLPPIRIGMAPDALAFSSNEGLLLAADTQSGDVAVIRVAGKQGPALFTILPAGNSPSAIAVKAMPTRP